MRKPFIAANWKMNNTVGDALKFVAAFTADLKAVGNVDCVLAPPFTALYAMNEALEGTEIRLAAQNLYWEESGAFTGEIAPRFLADVGCSHVIVGHSERRQLFGETDETVNRRLRAALGNGLVPILCVGETLEEREANRTWDVIERQLKDGLKGIDLAACEDFVVAYEPVWAIGTGMTATPQQAQEVHQLIRRLVLDQSDEKTAAAIRILYGGSVKPQNAAELFRQSDIDGGLIGGAALDADAFLAIVQSAVS